MWCNLSSALSIFYLHKYAHFTLYTVAPVALEVSLEMNNEYVPHLPKGTAQKLSGLLYMEYKPSELADELGITTATIYNKYLKEGLPHRKDSSGNLWIVGTAFADWARNRLKKKTRRIKLAMNEGYCGRCKAPRVFASMTLKRVLSAGRASYTGPCSICGATMLVIRRTHDKS